MGNLYFKGLTCIKANSNMKDNSRIIQYGELENYNYIMEIIILELLKMAKFTDKVNLYVAMEFIIKEISLIIYLMEWVNWNGIIKFIKENGKKVKCMVKVFIKIVNFNFKDFLIKTK